MKEKYIKFYKTFHKKFKNDKNLIHCSNLVSDNRIEIVVGMIIAVLVAIFSRLIYFSFLKK